MPSLLGTGPGMHYKRCLPVLWKFYSLYQNDTILCLSAANFEFKSQCHFNFQGVHKRLQYYTHDVVLKFVKCL